MIAAKQKIELKRRRSTLAYHKTSGRSDTDVS